MEDSVIHHHVSPFFDESLVVAKGTHNTSGGDSRGSEKADVVFYNLRLVKLKIK